MHCVWVAGEPRGHSELEPSENAAWFLLALWVAAGDVAWVCPELEAGRDGKTSLVGRLAGGKPRLGPGEGSITKIYI